MAFDVRDRRRVSLAVIATVVAAPILVLVSSDSDTVDSPTAADSGAGAVVVDADASTPNIPPTTAPGADEPVFMDGVEVGPGSQTIAIAVPAPPTGEIVNTEATFSNSVSDRTRCLVNGEIPTNRRIRIENVNNGRSITCTTLLGRFDQTAALVLHATLFSQLADVTDAPIRVEVQL